METVDTHMPAVALTGASAPALLLGMILLCAWAGGRAAGFVHVPRVVGLLLAGFGLRMVLGQVVGDDGGHSDTLSDSARVLIPVRDLALGLILFTIGGVFERSKLRSAGRRILTIGSLETSCTVACVLVGCGLIAVATHAEGQLRDSIMLAVLLALGAIATAPAATLFVLHEYQAKGPITDTILGLTGLNNVVCIVLFHVVFLTLAWFGLIDAAGQVSGHLAVSLTATTAGSLVLGAGLGVLISLAHARLSLSDAMLVLFGLLILLGAAQGRLQESFGATYNALLVALIAGAVFANVAMDAEKLSQHVRSMGAPIYAAFFVMAGFSLHVGDLRRMGWMGAVYVVARVAGKRIGCQWGVRRAGAPTRVNGRLGEALLCQAAVVIGLAGFVKDNWPTPAGKRFATIVLGSVVIFELIGPILLKRCVVLGGEVKAITLLRRAERPGGGSVLRRILRGLIQLAGAGKQTADLSPDQMTVGHFMRSNIQLIPDTANLDQVLHFIERSGYSEFPVVHPDGTFAGVIHYRDIHDVIYDPTLCDLVTAVDLADASCPVLEADLSVDDATDVFSAHGFGALPVVESAESRVIVGIVEQRDLLRALHRSTAGG